MPAAQPPPPPPPAAQLQPHRLRASLKEERLMQLVAELREELQQIKNEKTIDLLAFRRLQEQEPLLQRSLEVERQKVSEWRQQYDAEHSQRVECAARLQAASSELSTVSSQLQAQSAEHAAVKAELTGRVAALSEDSAAYKLAIERLLAAKASRDKQIAAIIAERNKIAQVLARNRVAERELDRDDTRRHSTDRLSSGSARRASSSSSSGRMDEQQQAGVSVSGKRQFGSLEAEDGAQPKERRSLAATPPARRAALSPVSPNSQAGTAAMSPRSHDTDKAQPEREREQRLMARVKATLARPTDDGTSVSAAGIDDGPLSPSAGWLSREEALHARRTSERMKRSVQLLEDKCHELEKQVSVLCADNRSLTVRFQAACEARHRAERKLRAAAEQQQQQQHSSAATQHWLR